MSPEWLPQSVLFMGGVLAGGVALHALANKEHRQALRMGVVSLALIGVAVALIQGKLTRMKGPAAKPLNLLVPATGALEESKLASGDSVSLLLGDNLRVLVAPSKQYAFSFGGRRFLILDVQNGRMAVSCRLADEENRMRATIVKNKFTARPGWPYYGAKADRHTFLVRGTDDEEALSIRYASPVEIRITGRFHLPKLSEPITITADGIHWPGGGLAAEMTVSLTQYGQGTIDFEPSGLIQILP